MWKGIDSSPRASIYRVPNLPFGWFDSPPGVNRLIGARWLLAVLYPGQPASELRRATLDFYRRFYHVSLDETQLDALLKEATPPPP